MQDQEQLIKAVGTVYRFVFGNLSIHKNVLRKKVMMKGLTKNRFYQAIDKLVASKGLLKDKDNLSINPKIVKTGILKREGDECYVFFEDSKKKYPVRKSVASPYQNDELLHVIIEQFAGVDQAIVLGRKIDDTYKAYLQRKYIEKFEHEKIKNEKCELGTVVKLSHDNLVFIPKRKDLPRQIPILNDKDEWAAFQDKVCLMRFEDKNNMEAGGTIVSVKGEAGNPIVEFESIAESFGGIMNWKGADVEVEIAKLPNSVDANTLNLVSEREFLQAPQGKTVDLRHLPFATVDPATCRDMDDAIYSTFDEKGNIVVYTAVANVTKYVDLDSAIGKRYIKGGFTIYSPNRAYNILPPELSTGICSLNPNEDRLAFVVKTTIDKTTGKVKGSKIFDAIIQSRKKYAYEDAQAIVDEKRDEITFGYLKEKVASGQPLTEEEQVMMNYHSANVIKRGFNSRGMIRFMANRERDIVFDDDFENVIDIKPAQHLYYHEVIEAFMITANEATAKFASDAGLTNIYRTHDEPNPHKKERAEEFFEIMGIDFDGDVSSSGIRQILEKVAGTPEEEVVNNFLIKMQSRAIYSDKLHSDAQVEKFYEENGEDVDIGGLVSHYALQSLHYSHTTSPIRRIADYATQYNVLAKLHGTKPLSKQKVQSLVRWANERQIEVDLAESQFDDVTSALYCESRIGQKMKGRISRFRYATPEDGCEDEIIVIVKNDATGVRASIPLSQVVGRKGCYAEISRAGSCVYDSNGNIILTLCKPVDFIIAGADRKTATVIGTTDKTIVEENENPLKYISGRTPFKIRGTDPGARHDIEKHSTGLRKKKSKEKDKRRRDREREDY